MKLIVFDFDSTLMDGETLEILAKEVGLEAQVKEITDKAMCGKTDFFESLQERVKLLKGIPETRVNEICKSLPPMNGLQETITELKHRGFCVICFSGGFQNATVPFVKKYGLDAEFSNTFHVKDGLLTGKVGGAMMFNNSKGEMLKHIQEITGTSVENTVVVGDGANDLSMFKHAGIRIAFCAKPVLKEQATIVIEQKDLKLILHELSN